MEDKKHEVCFICGGELDYYLTGEDYLYLVGSNKFDLYSCKGCKLKIINPLCKQEQLNSYYPGNYYAFRELESKSFLKKLKVNLININYKEKTSGLSDIFFRILNKIADVEMYFGVPLGSYGTKKFLDIGCGDGEFVRIMLQNGWDSYGYEIGEKKEVGRIFKHPDFTQVTFNNMKFDCIRIWHVFEHVANPREYLKKIFAILSDEGVVYIGLPNIDSINAKIFRKYWLGYDMPRHQINYNLTNIKNLLGKFNFEIIRHSYLGNMFFGSLGLLIKSKFNVNVKIPFILSAMPFLF